MPRKLPGLSPASPGMLVVAELIGGAITAQGINSATFTKARRRTSTALDRAFAACSSMHPAGMRIPLIKGSKLDKDIIAAARGIDQDTKYAERGYPSAKELDELCDFRFRHLDVYHRGEWLQHRKAMDPIAEEALLVCHHPTSRDVASAYRVLYENDRLRAGNCKALEYAWRRDFDRLRRSLERIELTSTGGFAGKFATLIDALGVRGAVLYVLEQAFEFERTFEYVAAHLVDFRNMGGGLGKKGLIFGDQDPNMFHLALSMKQRIKPRDWDGHARLNYEVLKSARLDHHQAQAPEGERWHLVLGRPPLHFIIQYLFHTYDRFASYLPAVTSSRFSLNSAIFRVALNILAHIDADEAQAELVARISHANERERPNGGSRSKGGKELPSLLERAIPRDRFDPFSSQGSDLPFEQIDDPDWADGYVARLRDRYDRLLTKGLVEEEKNPFARAFPFAQGWSRSRVTIALERVWYRARYALETLDPRYACPGHRNGHPLGAREIDLSLSLAADLVETPNPMSKARSLGLPIRGVTTWIPQADAW